MRTQSLAALAMLLVFAQSAASQVPHLISYQGRVSASGTNFDGTGLFKFALVSGGASSNAQANVVSHWSNDGTSSGGNEPLSSVGLPVSGGLFTVLLGDVTLTNMTPIPPTVFTNPDVRLRIWFNDGVHGPQRLAPDQRIAAVGYAMVAAEVPDGSIGPSKLANGSVTAEKLAPGVVQTNLSASGLSGVASGGIVLGLSPSSAPLTSAGFQNIGAVTLGQEWQTVLSGQGRRYAHTAVWTGTEMLAWGGGAGLFLNTGGRYKPANDSWQPITTSNAPAGRWFHQAVWTGTEMLVWGGRAAFSSGAGNKNDGARYDPLLDQWQPMNTDGAPEPRSDFAAVWTGTEMLIWGGTTDGHAAPAAGARYNPVSDEWTPMSTNGAPVGRQNPAFVWTGTEMIVWGGGDVTGGDFVKSFADGARYNPLTDQWTPLPTNGAPPAAALATAVWSGSEMIVWGGLDYGLRTPYGSTVSLATGARYSPATDSWRSIASLNAPVSRALQVAVWTGTEMILWSGVNRDVANAGQINLNNGARYDPQADKWTALSLQNAPSARVHATAVWTGQSMIAYAGYNNQDGSNELNTTHSWAPLHVLYLYQRP